MSPAPWLLLCALFLVLARALRPSAGRRSEIRGLARFLWWVNAFYCAVWHRLEIERTAPLPEKGPAILVSNHTCGIDHMILQAGCQRLLGFLTAREFYELRFARPFCRLVGCIPVRRDGRDLAATRAALRALQEGRVVPIFPEGGIRPTSGREIGPGKPGAAFLALRSRAPVIPAYIRGTPETNQVFRALGTSSEARLTFGDPIDLSRFLARSHFDRQTLEDATEAIMLAIHAVRDRSAACPQSPHDDSHRHVPRGC
jgi:1-acyl-sn-glycerol-3-phosphate acyltransferase